MTSVYRASPTTAPSAPASARTSASLLDVTPPDDMTGQGHPAMNLRAWLSSMPSRRPSTSTLVFRTPASGRPWILSNISSTVAEAASCHPLTAILPALVSIERTILPGWRSAISASHSGSLTALVPTTTRSAPAATSSSTASVERIPPPISAGTPASSTTLLNTGMLPSLPNAASRSTRCRYSAPLSTHMRATETGSGMTICWLPGTPPTSCTTWWSMTSTAGMTITVPTPRRR